METSTVSLHSVSAKMETKDDRQITGNEERKFDFSVSDFAKLVKTKSYVDKTLMIRDIFSGSSRVLITAPPRFGKSTIIDMVKRFLEIEVDIQCTPNAVHTTKNYRLFEDNNLDIYKDNEFFKKYFGKYPVVHIDFEPLNGVRDYLHMIDTFRTVVQKSFIQHSYLLNANKANIFCCCNNGFDINDFKKHVSNRLIKDIDAQDLMCSFEYLSTILYKHFEREVIVLIDNCDAYIKSQLSGKNHNPETEKIISFIKTTIKNLVRNNTCVEQVLLTGVLPVFGDVSDLSECYVECYSFMGNHPYCKYFGLTSDELDNILEKFVLDENERTEIKTTIDEFYGGYSAANQRVEVYSIWSVLQYIQTRKVQNYRGYITNFEPFFKNLWIIRKLAISLVNSYNSLLDTSQTLSATDVCELNKIITRDEVDDVPSSATDKLFLLLYHFGYFTIETVFANGCVSLKIPNESIKYELANVYIETTQIYYENKKMFNNIWFSIESFRPDNVDRDITFKTFSNEIHAWLQEESVDEQKKKIGVMLRLFIILLAQSKYNKTLYITSGEGSDRISHILLKNKHDVAICITAWKISDSGAPAETVMWNAETLHNEITDLDFDRLFNKYSRLCNKVIIAIATKLGSPGICIAYSYYFGEGNSLEKYKTLTFGFET